MNDEKLNLLGFIGLFLIALIVLLIPLGVRYFNGDSLFAGGYTYYNIRASEDLSTGNTFDSLQQQPHRISFFHYLLYPLINLLGEEKLIVIPIILSLVSLYLFLLISDLFFKDELSILISGLAFVLSPIFIYLFTSLTPYTFATPIFLFFIYLFLTKSNWSMLYLALLSVMNLSFFILAIILTLFESFYRKNNKFFIINLIPSLIVLGVFSYFFHNFLDADFLTPSFSSFLMSFGAKIGVAFFYLFLGLLGFFTISQRGRSYNYILLSSVIIFISSLFIISAKIIFNFYLCLFSAVMIIFLIKRDWAILTIKRFTLLLILCGIIFSTALYSNQLISSQPAKNLEHALFFLKNQPNGTVFSHQELGYFIQYFSQKKSFLDDSFNDEPNSTLNVVEHEIFFSRHLEITESLLKEYGINYILITSDMKDGLVWKKSDEGLLFLLKNTNTFKKIYDLENVEIWVYNPIS